MLSVKPRVISQWLVVAMLLVTTACIAADLKPQQPGKKDKCPVCGMFVAKYPAWTGEVRFKDGTTFFFDGPKDLFRFYFDLPTYAPKHQQSEVAAIYVTEYYDAKPIAARDAWYVIGSDVFGPMGKELIPLGNEADGKSFMADHQGKKLLRFNEITAELLKDM